MSEEKRYAQVPRSTVCLYAEAEGFSSLPDAAAALLAEDSNYRLRQVIQNASQLMRHGKRKCLTTTDINQALQWSQVEPLYGYESTEAMSYTSLREIDLFVSDDTEVNLISLTTEELTPTSVKSPSLKMQWLSVEGVVKMPLPTATPPGCGDLKPLSQQSSSSTDGIAKKKPAVVPQPQPQPPQQQPQQHVSEFLMAYYDQITQAILGSDQDLLQIALEDLHNNDRLTPLLPYLLNFVSVGVKKMGHDLTQLAKLLQTIQALVDNPSLYLGTQPYLTLLVQSILYCVLEPLAASLNSSQDHWTFRDGAARLLAHTLRRWSTSTNQLWCHTGQIMRDCFGDLSKPFSTHYGALVAIRAMGLQEVQVLVLPKLEVYWPHLLRSLEGGPGVGPQVKADAHKVHGTLLLLAEHVLKWRLKCSFPESWSLHERSLGHPILDTYQHPVSGLLQTGAYFGRASQPCVKTEFLPAPQSKNRQDNLSLYRMLYGFFGDALAIRLPCLPYVAGIWPPVDRRPQASPFPCPSELNQTGEELLQAFYEGVCEDESARSPANSMDEDNSYEENSPLSDEAPAVELQIRSTISDPALGIKLTIAKLRRDKDPPVVKEPCSSSSKGSKRKKSSKNDPGSAEVFERHPLKPALRPLVFNFEGGTPIPLEQLHRPGLPTPPPLPSELLVPTWKLSARMKKTGRRRRVKRPSRPNLFGHSFL